MGLFSKKKINAGSTSLLPEIIVEGSSQEDALFNRLRELTGIVVARGNHEKKAGSSNVCHESTANQFHAPSMDARSPASAPTKMINEGKLLENELKKALVPTLGKLKGLNRLKSEVQSALEDVKDELQDEIFQLEASEKPVPKALQSACDVLEEAYFDLDCVDLDSMFNHLSSIFGVDGSKIQCAESPVDATNDSHEHMPEKLQKNQLPAGKYVIGEDIPEGTYDFRVVFGDGDFSLFQDAEKASLGWDKGEALHCSLKMLPDNWRSDRLFNIQFNRGNILILKGTPIVVAISKSNAIHLDL